MSAEKHRNMTRPEFYKLCEELHKRAEMFLKERPSLSRAAKQLSEWLGFRVTLSAVSEAQEATGIRWTSTRKNATSEQKYHRTRIILKALIRLYRKLGEEVPQDLLQCYADYEGRSLEEISRYWRNEAPANGQPAKPAESEPPDPRGGHFNRAQPAPGFRPGNANK